MRRRVSHRVLYASRPVVVDVQFELVVLKVLALTVRLLVFVYVDRTASQVEAVERCAQR